MKRRRDFLLRLGVTLLGLLVDHAYPAIRVRYEQTVQLLVGLERAHYSAEIGSAMQLRDLRRFVPPLKAFEQLPEECDKLINRRPSD